MDNSKILYKDKILKIINIPTANQRKITKIRIFLNSNQHIKYVLEEDALIITFLINDENLISDEISKIFNFIESVLQIEIIRDDYINEKISHNNMSHDSFKSNTELLRKLKSENIFEDDSFKKYCEYCDYSLKIKLRPYQYTASYYLTINNGGFDFSVPGSGKTIISYAAYNYLKHKNQVDYMVIIGPINSFNAWYDEYITCFNKEPSFINLANSAKDDVKSYLSSSISNHSEILFINVDKAWRFTKDIIDYFNNKKVMLIIDEAHKEKNPNANITKAVLEITKSAKARIVLTGTPMPNGYEDLYSLMNIYSPYDKIIPFNYKVLSSFTKNGIKEEDEKNLMNSIAPYYSRVSKKYLLETKELSEPVYNYVSCNLSDNQLEVYDFLNKFSFEIDDDWESSFNLNLMKAVAIRKMQVSANPGLLSKSIVNSIDEYMKEYCDEYEIDDSQNDLLMKADNLIRNKIANSNIAKLIYKFELGALSIPKNDKAVEIAVDLVKQGKKVIIWDVFVQNMYCLKNLLNNKQNSRVEIINGTVNGNDRIDAINRFKYGNSMILIANPATLAESISLHKVCQHAIYVNRNYNAAQFIQSKDRIHRINMPLGTTANYYFLINEDTIDEAVDNRLELKEQRMLRILDSSNIEIGGQEFENDSFMSKDDIIESYKK